MTARRKGGALIDFEVPQRQGLAGGEDQGVWEGKGKRRERRGEKERERDTNI